MGVMMQAFYWDCPAIEGRPFQWWDHVRSEVPRLAAAGFTALWLPPANKAASNTSMGYDPYDFWDLGEFDQKGSVATWFGTRAELESLIAAAHGANLQVYADYVIDHCSGADAEEPSPVDGISRWTKFTPKSGKFPRDTNSFHPSRYETWDAMTFRRHARSVPPQPRRLYRDPRKRRVADQRDRVRRFPLRFRQGLWRVDGARHPGTARSARRGAFKPFSVGECWDNSRTIEDWLTETNAWSDNPVSAFDFPLRYRLRDLCQVYGFSLRALTAGGTVLADDPARAVTFVENHDVVRDDPIRADKMLAYAYILTHPGYPCVFWQDYYTWGLALPGEPSGIDALARVHEDHAGGDTQILYCDDDLYIMQRTGWGNQRGLVFVLNNRGSWNGATVRTTWPNTSFSPVAWRGQDLGTPLPKHTGPDGAADFWAPPRGYAVYVPR